MNPLRSLLNRLGCPGFACRHYTEATKYERKCWYEPQCWRGYLTLLLGLRRIVKT